MVSRKVREEEQNNAERMAAVAAEQAATEPVQEDKSNRLVLTSGIVFRQKPVPPLLIRKAARNIPRPVVPTVWLEEKGRDEENPNDPSYLAAMNEYLEATGLAALDAVIITGLILEYVPDGIYKPEDDGWLEDFEALGLPIEFKSEKGRFLEWVKSVALAEAADYQKLQQWVQRQLGMSEEDVATAIDSFRGDEGRGTVTELSPAPQSTNGHRVPSDNSGDSA